MKKKAQCCECGTTFPIQVLDYCGKDKHNNPEYICYDCSLLDDDEDDEGKAND